MRLFEAAARASGMSWSSLRTGSPASQVQTCQNSRTPFRYREWEKSSEKPDWVLGAAGGPPAGTAGKRKAPRGAGAFEEQIHTTRSEMSKFKGTGFDERLSTAATAKKAELEKFRAKSGANDPDSPNGRPPRTQSTSPAMRALSSARRPSWRVLPVRPPRRPPAMSRSPSRPPVMSPWKPNAGRPAMPAMPRVRRDRENDSAHGQAAGAPSRAVPFCLSHVGFAGDPPLCGRPGGTAIHDVNRNHFGSMRV